MADVTGTEEKKVNLFKRGTDEVDRDAYVKALDAGLNDWINNLYIRRDRKGEKRAAVREAAKTWLNRINSENNGGLSFELGGGWNDMLGKISNAEPGEFDANGLVAGYFEDVLRKMDAYKAPEKVDDRPEWGNNFLANEFSKGLNAGGGINNFSLMDPLSKNDKNKEVWNQTNRIAYLKSFRDKYATYDDATKKWSVKTDGFKNMTQQQIDEYQAQIDLLNTILYDDKIEEREYFDLARILGRNNYGDLFSTDKSKRGKFQTTSSASNSGASNTGASNAGTNTGVSNNSASNTNSDSFDYDGFYNHLTNQGYSTTSYDNRTISLDGNVDMNKFSFDKNANILYGALNQYINSGNEGVLSALPGAGTGHSSLQIAQGILRTIQSMGDGSIGEQLSDGTYLLPSTFGRDKSTAYIWNPSTGKITTQNGFSNDAWKNRLKREYISTHGGSSSRTSSSPFAVHFQKQGGSIQKSKTNRWVEELKKKSSDNKVVKGSVGTSINSTWSKKPKDKPSTFDKLGQYVPQGLDFIRFTESLRTNEKNEKLLENAYKKITFETPEQVSVGQTTTDAATRDKGYKDIADFTTFANKAQTSDASLHQAQVLQARATGLAHKAKVDMAYNTSAKESMDENAKLNRSNELSRIKTANTHRKALDAAEKTVAGIKSNKLLADNNSINNYLTQIGAKHEAKLAEKEQMDELAETQRINDIYKDEEEMIENALMKWKAANPDKVSDIRSQTWYDAVSKRQKEIAQRKQNDLLMWKGKYRNLNYYDSFEKNPYKQRLDWNNIIS